MAICPPFVAIAAAWKALLEARVASAPGLLLTNKEGAITGEVSPDAQSCRLRMVISATANAAILWRNPRRVCKKIVPRLKPE